jgi:hypothetical protein
MFLLHFWGIKHINRDYVQSKFFRFFVWGLAIISIYIFLLPLGGYRVYRPYILRFDTLLPMNIFLIWLFAFSSHYLLNRLDLRLKKMYLVPLLLMLVVFYAVDKLKMDSYDCQNDKLHRLQQETQEPIVLNKDCFVLTWEPNNWEEQKHGINLMLIRWGILSKEKKYRYE